VTAAPPGLTHLHSGKVRDLFRTDDGRLVMVASDRISAFDYVLASTIPDKGRILTAMTVWWFGRLDGIVANHLLALDDPLVPAAWRGRAMVCTALSMVPVEAVARGYLTGSGLLDYAATGEVCGIPLPAGLVDGDRLPEPLFTPATKAALGEHDENVSYDAVAATVGIETAAELRDLTLRIYGFAADIARGRGIILADTKFEFGRDRATGGLVLGDEVLTPDSSRFWPADDWQPGRSQPSYDKQYVRNWLTENGLNGQAAELPEDVVDQTRSRYVEAYERLTGLRFADWPG
jgi:phosphoribosylaminoimidazole-succinocarboxamide synthase